MSSLKESFLLLLGGKSKRPKPEEISPEAAAIHEAHRGKRPKEEVEIRRRAKQENFTNTNWRRKRWTVLILVNLLFVASYFLDIQLLEGALTGSRFAGLHLADLNATLQVMLAFKHVLINLLIGTVTIGIMWWLLGGRTFCSWVCPYHLLSEWGEIIHLKLRKKKLAMDIKFDRRTRTYLWLLFAVLAFVTSYTVYETISPTGIISRALIYGPGLALTWVLFILLFEIFFSRRAWCRYACPIGLTYGVIGLTSPLQVQLHLDTCYHDGQCIKVCLVPHVLDVTKARRAVKPIVDIGADCTRCGRCVEVCPTKSLKFKFKGISK
ncbi:MAG: ferredoxin [Acidobacteria bacterium]|nr:MAG: ferredoxin [Acidobacteriota bacterium]